MYLITLKNWTKNNIWLIFTIVTCFEVIRPNSMNELMGYYGFVHSTSMSIWDFLRVPTRRETRKTGYNVIVNDWKWLLEKLRDFKIFQLRGKFREFQSQYFLWLVLIYYSIGCIVIISHMVSVNNRTYCTLVSGDLSILFFIVSIILHFYHVHLYPELVFYKPL
jgi:hypothetical protein